MSPQIPGITKLSRSERRIGIIPPEEQHPLAQIFRDSMNESANGDFGLGSQQMLQHVCMKGGGGGGNSDKQQNFFGLLGEVAEQVGVVLQSASERRAEKARLRKEKRESRGGSRSLLSSGQQSSSKKYGIQWRDSGSSDE